MNVLFLDDSQARIAEFLEAVPSAVTVETASECMHALRDGPPDSDGSHWDLLFLDHDLEGEIFVDSQRPDTGMEVVRWIESNRPVVGGILVHTHNEAAGFEMKERLRVAGYDVRYVPFGFADPVELCEEFRRRNRQ